MTLERVYNHIIMTDAPQSVEPGVITNRQEPLGIPPLPVSQSDIVHPPSNQPKEKRDHSKPRRLDDSDQEKIDKAIAEGPRGEQARIQRLEHSVKADLGAVDQLSNGREGEYTPALKGAISAAIKDAEKLHELKGSVKNIEVKSPQATVDINELKERKERLSRTVDRAEQRLKKHKDEEDEHYYQSDLDRASSQYTAANEALTNALNARAETPETAVTQQPTTPLEQRRGWRELPVLRGVFGRRQNQQDIRVATPEDREVMDRTVTDLEQQAQENGINLDENARFNPEEDTTNTAQQAVNTQPQHRRYTRNGRTYEVLAEGNIITAPLRYINNVLANTRFFRNIHEINERDRKKEEEKKRRQ